MIKRRRLPKIFFGWWTVFAGGFLSFWGFGYYSPGMSALFKPLASELGFSRAATSVATGIGKFGGGFEAPLTGWLTDRFGPRWIIFPGVFLTGLGFILMMFIDSLWAFYVVWGVIAATGVNIALTVSLDKAIANWFIKKRGTALSIRWLFTGLSPLMVLPLVAWLISTQGWRMTCLIGGVVMWLVGLPLAWFFVKQHRPEYYGLLPDGATTEEEGADTSEMIDRGIEYAAEVQEVEFTLRQAMRTPAYWLLIVAQAAHGMVIPAIAIHCMPFLTDMGIDPVKAAVTLGMTNAFSLPVRFTIGFIADHVKNTHLRFLLGGAFFLQAAGITVFLLNQTIDMVHVFFIFYYIGLGGGLPLIAAIRGRYFGRKAFGSISGSSAMFIAPVGMIAPIYAGWVYDTTGSYITALTLFAALLAFATVVMVLTSPPQQPAQITDIHKIV